MLAAALPVLIAGLLSPLRHPSIRAPAPVATLAPAAALPPQLNQSAAPPLQPAVVRGRFAGPLLRLPNLWPNTLGKFWGLNALGWAVGTAALTPRSPAVLPLVAANAALAATLYRSREDANNVLATAAAVYFGGNAAMLCLAPPVIGAGFALALPWLRAWHLALTAGSVVFAIKASLKDRLFALDGSMRRSRAAHTDATRLPTLVFLNKQAGAKLASRVAEAFDEVVAEASTEGRILEVVDMASYKPAEALRDFAKRHVPFRVFVGSPTSTPALRCHPARRSTQAAACRLPCASDNPLPLDLPQVCGGDGSASWVLGPPSTTFGPLRISYSTRLDSTRLDSTRLDSTRLSKRTLHTANS